MRGSRTPSAHEPVGVARRDVVPAARVEFAEAWDPEPADADLLEVGGVPRRPAPVHRRRLRAGVGAVALTAVAAVTVAVAHRPGSPAPTAVAAPAPAPIAGSASGPSLTQVGGVTELTVPGGDLSGGSAHVPLAPAPAAVAAIADRLPGFSDVQGGAVVDDDVHYGLYLTGTYVDATGAQGTLTVYTAHAPGTTPGTDSLVSRTRFDHSYTVSTEVTAFTGTGWWVKIATVRPDDGVAGAPGEVDTRADQVPTLTALALDARLTS